MLTPRSRSRGKYTQTSYIYEQWNGVIGAGSCAPNGMKETMTDYVNPRFHERSAEGEVIMTPMVQVKTTQTTSQLSSFYGLHAPITQPTQWSRFVGDMAFYELQLGTAEPGTPAFVHTGPQEESVYVDASTQCLSQIGRSDADNWENVAEAGKTVEMLRHPLNSWFAFERKARLASAGLTLAQAWLMYRFGIRPLVMSVEETLKALREDSQPVRVTTRAKATSTQSTNVDVAWTAGAHTRRYHVETHETIEARAMSLDTAVNTLTHKMGFGSKSLLTLPWELLPYSFVIDYFVNVGAFIGALANFFQPASLGQCLVTKRTWTQTRTSFAHTTSGTDQIVTPGLSQSITTYVRKERMAALRTPSIVFKSDFRLDNAVRIGNLLALVGQQVTSRFVR